MALALTAVFADLPDPRRDTTNKLHRLTDILTIATCATIAGADGWEPVAADGEAKTDFFARFLDRENGIPSHDTFYRVFTRLDPDAFADRFGRWMAAACEATGLVHVAIDGKSARRSKRGTFTGCLHLVEAWAVENRLILGQRSVPEGGHEIATIPDLLAALDLTGAVVTIDAMGGQREIAGRAIEPGGDDVLAVQENPPTLYAEGERVGEAARASEYAGASGHCTEERGRGRDELRACWGSTDLAALGERPKWPGLRSVAVAVRDRAVAGKNGREAHDDIASRAMTAKEFLEVTRAHWGIEDSLHWALDVSFGEDRSRVRMDYGLENFALLRRRAVSMLQAEKSQGSIRGKRLIAGWNNEFLESVLLDFTEN